MVIAAVLATADATVPGGPGSAGGRSVAVGLALVEGLSLLWMRRASGWAMGMAILAGVALQALCPFVGSWGGATVALSSLARLRPPRFSLWGLAAMLALAPVNAVRGSWAQVVIAGAAACVAWARGERGRAREARREADARRMVAEERAALPGSCTTWLRTRWG